MKRRTFAVLSAALAVLGVVAAPLRAEAQEATGQASVSGQAAVTAPAPPAPPAPPPREREAREPRDEEPDHERFIGHFAVGYFGISQLPIARENPTAATGLVRDNVNAPVIGVRYWLQRNIGIDAGLGFWLNGGSIEQVNGGTTTTNDKKSQLGFALHGGVPLAFAHGRHYSFLVVPEATLGIASGTFKTPAAGAGTAQPDQDLSGFKLDLGARVGAEIHFGFIGIPELSLEGSVGLFFRRETIKWKQDNASASDGTTTVSTSVQSDPWAIFVNNISAFYYF